MPVTYNSIRRVFATLLLSGVAACGDDGGVAEVPVRVELTPDRDSLVVGEVATPFVAQAFNARDEPIPGALFTWRSDQPSIAAVDSLTGRVIAVARGVAAITARTGLVADTSEVFVIAPVSLSLPLDTVILVPGDTFSVPVILQVAGGGAPPPVIFGGGNASVASVDPSSGLVTAIGEGVVAFTAQADTVAVRGGIEVRSVTDTLNGTFYLGLSRALDRRGRFASRGFNHPTDDGGTAIQLVADGADGLRRMAFLLTDSLSGTRIDTVGTLAPSDLDPGQDPVCLPPTSWVFYRDDSGSPSAVALSLGGGTVRFTSVAPIPGGWAVSGRLQATLQLTDVAGAPGRVSAIATFAVPVVSLATCPK